MRLIITRHGESVANSKNVIAGVLNTRLSALGKKQAKALASRLKNEKINHIYSSDLSRALNTAKAIQAFHKKTPHHIRESARERCAGEWEGVHASKLKKNPKGFESDRKLMNRARKFLKEIMKKHTDETILIAAHSNFNKALLGVIMNNKKYPHEIEQDNTCVNICHLAPARKVELVNCTKHL